MHRFKERRTKLPPYLSLWPVVWVLEVTAFEVFRCCLLSQIRHPRLLVLPRKRGSWKKRQRTVATAVQVNSHSIWGLSSGKHGIYFCSNNVNRKLLGELTIFISYSILCVPEILVFLVLKGWVKSLVTFSGCQVWVHELALAPQAIH